MQHSRPADLLQPHLPLTAVPSISICFYSGVDTVFDLMEMEDDARRELLQVGGSSRQRSGARAAAGNLT